jgi:hypothetical protein
MNTVADALSRLQKVDKLVENSMKTIKISIKVISQKKLTMTSIQSAARKQNGCLCIVDQLI